MLISSRSTAMRSTMPFLSLFAICGFCYYYVANEQQAYIWDYGNYFHIYQQMGQRIAAGGSGWLETAWHSIQYEDYNVSGTIPLYPFYAMLGGTRAGYIIAVVLAYLIPACLLSAAILLYAYKEGERPLAPPAAALISGAAILYWPMWMPTLRGYLDVAGTIPLGIATLVALRSRFFCERSLRSGIQVGFLIWLAILLRRWYVYAGVGLLGATALFCLYACVTAKQNRADLAKRAAIGGAAALGVIALCMLTLQRPFLLQALSDSYSDAFVAYRFSLQQGLLRLYRIAGIVLAVPLAFGLALAIAKRNVAIIFCATAGTLTFFAFHTVQTPGAHHTLPIFFWFFTAFGYALLSLLNALPARIRSATATLLLAAILASFLGIFSPGAREALQSLHPLLPTRPALPLKLDHFTDYRRMISDILKLTGDRDKFAVFASYPVICDSLLVEIEPNLKSKIEFTAQVDRRDGMWLAPARAKYAIVTDPVAFHLSMNSQQVIVTPATKILQRSGFGAAYTQVSGPYTLADGYRAFIFRRDRELGTNDLADLLSELRNSYPTWKQDGDRFR